MKAEELEQKIERVKAQKKALLKKLAKYESDLEKAKSEKQNLAPFIPRLGETYYEYRSTGGIITQAVYDGTILDLETVSDFSAFETEEKAKECRSWQKSCRQALMDIANGNPISIEVIKPFLKKGWVACDKDGTWWWYANKPSLSRHISRWLVRDEDYFKFTWQFDLIPAERWRQSLMEVG